MVSVSIGGTAHFHKDVCNDSMVISQQSASIQANESVKNTYHYAKLSADHSNQGLSAMTKSE